MSHRFSVGALIVSVALLAGCDSSNDAEPANDAPLEPPAAGTDPDPAPDPAPQIVLPPSVRWDTSYAGSLLGRYVIAGDAATVVTLSRDAESGMVMTAIDPATGAERWQLADVANCVPTLTPGGDVLVQLDRATATGGRDDTDDIALIDAAHGTIIDTWAPEEGVLLPCGTDTLLVTAGGVVVSALRGELVAVSALGTTLDPLWSRRFEREAADDQIVAGRAPSLFNDAVVSGERLYLASHEDRGDGGERAVTIYQLDAATGESLGRIDLALQTLTGLHIAGPDELLVTGNARADRADTAVLLRGVSADAEPNALSVAWSRGFDGDLDGITGRVSPDAIAVSDGAFASWSQTDSVRGVAEFDLATGLSTFVAPASSFSNNDSISALPTGGYAVFPFGGHFVETVDGIGQPDWSIDAVEGYGFASAMGVFGQTLVMVAARNDGGWGFVGIGPITANTP